MCWRPSKRRMEEYYRIRLLSETWKEGLNYRDPYNELQFYFLQKYRTTATLFKSLTQ